MLTCYTAAISCAVRSVSSWVLSDTYRIYTVWLASHSFAHFAAVIMQMSSKQQLERLFADDEEPTTPLVNSMHNGLIAETPEHVVGL